MNVKLIAHTKLAAEFRRELDGDDPYMGVIESWNPTDGVADSQMVALTAIRTCYSANKPTEIVAKEGAKYFGRTASDGEEGTEADRLFRHIVRSGHASTLEHITYTFAIEGVSRSLLAQLTRHRQLSFSVQSQRYVKFGSDDKSGGFDYVMPPSVADKLTKVESYSIGCGHSADLIPAAVYEEAMEASQYFYDKLREAGVPAEDARFVLPNAAACNLVMTGNLRALLEFYSKRNASTHAQWEIADLAEKIREEIVKVDGWLTPFFGGKKEA